VVETVDDVACDEVTTELLEDTVDNDEVVLEGDVLEGVVDVELLEAASLARLLVAEEVEEPLESALDDRLLVDVVLAGLLVVEDTATAALACTGVVLAELEEELLTETEEELLTSLAPRIPLALMAAPRVLLM